MASFIHSAPAAPAQAMNNPQQEARLAASRLNQIVRAEWQARGFKTSELSLSVGSVWNINGDQPMSPASLSKLVTLAVTLHELHPNFTFQTTLATSQQSLYLVGGGDPSFVSESLWSLVNDFTRSGIHEIQGDVVVDDSLFDDERFTETRKEKRVDRAYDAPISAMSFNWNSVNIYVRPGKLGAPCLVTADPENNYIRIRNETKTTGNSGNSIQVQRQEGEPGETFMVSGQLALGHKELVIFKNIQKPELWAGANLVQFLRERGITLKGSIKHGVAPKDAVVVATFTSKPLSEIVQDMAKYSNNFVAEMLIKNLAAHEGEKPATMATGIARAQAYLEKIGLRAAVFVNGSGFTEGNRLSSKQIVELLTNVENDFTIWPEYISALPIAGRDGTLKKRMKESPAEGQLRAKTGLLDGAIGLAGFVSHAPGEALPFAFIYNGAGKEEQARALFDRLAIAMAK
jgi:D-alanyl-D-alanine carboxypeptidase/D-alanyl-D-alanine-endopeptidase (penicillin-binding protein 4)